MYNTLRINQKSLNVLRERIPLNGTGVESDPLIINSLKGLNNFVRFKKILLHIHIKNIIIGGIRLLKCRNFTITNCSIANLNLSACSNITVLNCKIIHGDLTYCRNSTFKNNTFDRDNAYHRFNEKGIKQSDITFLNNKTDTLIHSYLSFSDQSREHFKIR